MYSDKFQHPDIVDYLARVEASTFDPLQRQQAVENAKRQLDQQLPANPTNEDVTWALAKMEPLGVSTGRRSVIRSERSPALVTVGLILGALVAFYLATKYVVIGVLLGVAMTFSPTLLRGSKLEGQAEVLRRLGPFIIFVAIASNIFFAMAMLPFSVP